MMRRNVGVGVLVALIIFVFGMGTWAANPPKVTPTPQGKTPTPTPVSSAAIPSTTGLINLSKLFEAHPNTQKIADVEKTLMDEMQKRQQDLNDKGKGKTRDEVQKLEGEMNTEWAPVRDEMLKNRQDLINGRYNDVIAAIKKVAESMRLSLVVRSELRIPVNQKEVMEMPLVLYGGTDITDKVIEQLKIILGTPETK
ncbi:MAG: OmpH family outer membrane protein [Atribacterota bacterium]|nr:OmpH family outer membrane protein [Candidatus Atribacteria bacterium]